MAKISIKRMTSVDLIQAEKKISRKETIKTFKRLLISWINQKSLRL